MSDKMKRRTTYEEARGSLHLTPKEWIKNLFPPGYDITGFLESMTLAAFGTTAKQREEIKQQILKTEEERARVEGKLIGLKRKLDDMEREEERLLLIKREAEAKEKYAHWVAFRLLLQGSILGKEEAIKSAYGVSLRKKIGEWSELLWRKHSEAEYDSRGEQINIDPEMNIEPYLKELLARFYEILPGISYVGRGKQEKKEFQSYLDVLSGSLRVCGHGHVYDTLLPHCSHCRVPKEGIYLTFEEGDISGYVGDQQIRDAYKMYLATENEKRVQENLRRIGAHSRVALTDGTEVIPE